jgi:hypothetical protein
MAVITVVLQAFGKYRDGDFKYVPERTPRLVKNTCFSSSSGSWVRTVAVATVLTH